jgi:hypothetical protein
MFSESTVLVCASRPPGGAVNSWNSKRSHVDFLGIVPWDNPSTKVVLFSACRQLAGRPQQFFWSHWMRGKNRVHTILSYRETAPAASTSADINNAFVAALKRGDPFVKAWRSAHSGGGLKKRWAALSYRSAVDDRMDKWAKTGSLSSTPADGEDILYFDEDHKSGRVVSEPDQVLDCFLTFKSSTRPTVTPLTNGMRLVPWYPLRKEMRLNLHLKWMDPAGAFQTGDIVWLALLQVRPDYGGPFDIEQILQIDNFSTLFSHGEVFTLGRIHNAKTGWVPDDYSDLYQFEIDRSGMSWLTHDSKWNEIVIPVTVGNAINDHVPVYYFMVRIQRDGTNIGIPTEIHKKTGLEIADQSRLPDDFQYQMFVLFDDASA